MNAVIRDRDTVLGTHTGATGLAPTRPGYEQPRDRHTTASVATHGRDARQSLARQDRLLDSHDPPAMAIRALTTGDPVPGSVRHTDPSTRGTRHGRSMTTAHDSRTALIDV